MPSPNLHTDPRNPNLLLPPITGPLENDPHPRQAVAPAPGHNDIGEICPSCGDYGTLCGEFEGRQMDHQEEFVLSP